MDWGMGEGGALKTGNVAMHPCSAEMRTLQVELHHIILHHHSDSRFQSPMCERQEGFTEGRNMQYSTDSNWSGTLDTLEDWIEDDRANPCRVDDVAISQLNWDDVRLVCWFVM